MLRDVTLFGTAARASAQLKRRDLAGKTGTTNDYYDAWFCGYQATVAGCAWMGYDQPKKLGSRETGGVAALPIWIAYMQTALRGVPEQIPSPPSGLTAPPGGDGRSLMYTENLPLLHSDESPAGEPGAALPEERKAPAAQAVGIVPASTADLPSSYDRH